LSRRDQVPPGELPGRHQELRPGHPELPQRQQGRVSRTEEGYVPGTTRPEGRCGKTVPSRAATLPENQRSIAGPGAASQVGRFHYCAKDRVGVATVNRIRSMDFGMVGDE